MQALLSIHDVMPDTLDCVSAILSRIRKSIPEGPVYLLVVPGVDWGDDGLQRLRVWEAEGCRLAGHGWVHRAGPPRSLYHRMHALLFSRCVAEHLAVDADGVLSLMQRCHEWFGDRGLSKPDLYVPPAWALGPLPLGRLRESSFPYVEILRGLVDSVPGRLRRLPLVGFEADNGVREMFLRMWNRHQANRAIAGEIPLRIAVHPHDLTLRLAPQIDAILSRVTHPVSVEEACRSAV